MSRRSISAGRAITDYFNSNAWHAPQESDLLAALMTEMMRQSESAINSLLIERIAAQLNEEPDDAMRQTYCMVLARVSASHKKQRSASAPEASGY
ncbi:hypothetical protein BTJ39_18990 [Izhakiella australiensis]|uniref:Biofilm development protein YmgB/AriR n=1 Tax=Izhakiella australiensis TaxID=1926881 RepID=A0A1S8YG58_9GAMM|nr:hypothetical protein [Izhakiella australiensis]OON38059.1 hypothetical protein BTJ39_18990 [Izhakiella australiensis]